MDNLPPNAVVNIVAGIICGTIIASCLSLGLMWRRRNQEAAEEAAAFDSDTVDERGVELRGGAGSARSQQEGAI